MSITQYNSSVRQMSQSKFNSMKNASGKIPDLANQIVMTNSEDENYDYLRMKLLWTNPNPTNAFPAQTITLNSDDYDYLIIRCSVRLPADNQEDPMWQTYMIKKGDVSFHMFVLTTSSTSEYRGEMMDRVAKNITSTSIHFENAGYMQNSTANAVGIDYVMIPQQVMGVKVV